MRRCIAALVFLGASIAGARAAESAIEVADSTSTLPLATIEVRGNTFSSPNEVEVLAWTLEGDEIRVWVDYHIAPSDDVVSSFRHRFMMPAPPPGKYELVFLSRTNADSAFREEARATAALDAEWPRPHFARTALVWPPDPTPLDEVSYYFAPYSSCQGEFFTTAETDQERVSGEGYIDRVFIEQSREPCELVRRAELQSIALGHLKVGEHRLIAGYQYEDIIIDPQPELDDRQFHVRAALPGRLSGSWYNPDQDGHGLTLEVLEDGQRLLAYWFTFDDQGNQAWVLADGTVDETGKVVEMEATLFTGGRFPPAFDPDDVTGTPWGSITLEFSDCNSASMNWDTQVAGFSDGAMPLQRLSTISGYGCDTPPPESLLENRWRLMPYPVVEESAEPPA